MRNTKTGQIRLFVGWLAAAAVVAAGLSGCTPTEDSECIPGAEQECDCPDGVEETRECETGGTWESCEVCDDPVTNDDNHNGTDDAGVDDAGDDDADAGESDDAGDGDDDSTVGPDGGTVVGPEGLEIEVPQGAVDEEVDVEVQVVSLDDLPAFPALIGAAGEARAIDAPDAVFSAGATVRIPFEDETHHPVGLWANEGDERLTVAEDDDQTRVLDGEATGPWEMELGEPVDWVVLGTIELFWETHAFPDTDVVDFAPRGVAGAPRSVYAASSSTVYFSSDAGDTWEQMGQDGPLPTGAELQSIGGESTEHWVGTTEGVWELDHRLDPPHSEWEAINEGLPADRSVSAVADEDSSSRMVGLVDGGVYRAPRGPTEDTDDDWILSGLETQTITTFQRLTEGQVAAADGDGLYQRDANADPEQWDHLFDTPSTIHHIEPVGSGFASSDLLLATSDGVHRIGGFSPSPEQRNDGFGPLTGAPPEIVTVRRHEGGYVLAASADGVFAAEFDEGDQITDWQPASYGLDTDGEPPEIRALEQRTLDMDGDKKFQLLGTDAGLYRARVRTE